MTLPVSVQFNDASSGAIASRSWDFGDGSPPSVATNPLHTYATPGDYTVTLEDRGIWGKVSRKTKTVHALNYVNRILLTQPTYLLACWALSETSGIVAANSQGVAARNGTYVGGVTLNAATFIDGTPAPSFDGVDDYVNIFSSSLQSAFNPNELTLMAWMRVSSSGDWTPNDNRAVVSLTNNGPNNVRIQKIATNQLRAQYSAGGTNKLVAMTTTSTDWLNVIITASKSADEVKVYLNGSQAGTTQTGLGTWSGTLNSATTIIGSLSTIVNGLWHGFIKYVTLWSIPLSAAEVTALATV